ncbi:MAG: LptF/LptG family permease, partial [Hydrogenophaga sp.]|nr:LptF/LptG family permease [Hydrogenophaga sp.]
DGREGRNIFISSTETDGRETITSARSGRIEWVDDRQFLLLNNGQRLEAQPDDALRVSEFAEYGTQIGDSIVRGGAGVELKARPTWELITSPSQPNLAELGWRIGLAVTAFNFVLIALATTAGNPRAGRSGNLFFTLFAFVFYYNLLNIGQNWVARGVVGLWPYTLALHGGVLAITLLWFYKRHHGLSLRSAIARMLASRGGAAP